MAELHGACHLFTRWVAGRIKNYRNPKKKKKKKKTKKTKLLVPPRHVSFLVRSRRLFHASLTRVSRLLRGPQPFVLPKLSLQPWQAPPIWIEDCQALEFTLPFPHLCAVFPPGPQGASSTAKRTASWNSRYPRTASILAGFRRRVRFVEWSPRAMVSLQCLRGRF